MLLLGYVVLSKAVTVCYNHRSPTTDQIIDQDLLGRPFAPYWYKCRTCSSVGSFRFTKINWTSMDTRNKEEEDDEDASAQR